jgi:hypothetical protein
MQFGIEVGEQVDGVIRNGPAWPPTTCSGTALTAAAALAGLVQEMPGTLPVQQGPAPQVQRLIIPSL